MQAYVAGDRRAFERLYARLAPRVHGFFVRTFGDRAVADDLLQTTFLKVHRARDAFRQGSALRPWLFAIAARVRLDELRKRRRLPEDLDEEALERAEQAAPSPAPDPASGDTAARVRAALDALPESQRVVVHLHRYEGMTFGEIARALGLGESAVKVRAFRAYGRLRELLADLDGQKEVA